MKKLRIAFLLTVLLSSFLITSCSTENESIDDTIDVSNTVGLPIVKTNNNFTAALTTNPKLGGTISSDGGSPITASGIVWSTKNNPTIANYKTNDNVKVGAFSSTMTGLQPKTTYYVKAYATNSQGTAYGDERTITTAGITLPLMTANIDNVQYDVMRPFGFLLFGDQVKVQNDGAEIGAPRFLWIIGDTSNNLNTMIEISLHIPNNMWKLGTYNLYERYDLSDFAECQAHLILNNGKLSKITSGTLTVTEFNFSTRRIKGTFSFTYSQSDTVGDFKVTNGTFNYGLNVPYFN